MHADTYIALRVDSPSYVGLKTLLIYTALAGGMQAFVWGVYSGFQQWSNGHCGANSDCFHNIQMALLVGLLISTLLALSFFAALCLFLRHRTARCRYALLFVALATGAISGLITVKKMYLLGAPYDLVLWPLVYFIITTTVIFVFFRNYSSEPGQTRRLFSRWIRRIGQRCSVPSIKKALNRVGNAEP